MESNEINIYPKKAKNEILNKIVNIIKKIREEKCSNPKKNERNMMTKINVSKRLGEKTRFVSELEQGDIELDLFTFINMCNVLNISSNMVLSEFIKNDVDTKSFETLNKNKKEIIKELVDVISDSSDTGITHSTEYKKFDEYILRKRIKSFREDKNIGIRELASKLRKSHSYINNIEKGNSNLSIPAMIELCNALDFTPNDLLQPFLTTNKLNDYNNLNSENKAIVDALIKICNQKQQKVGYMSKRMATPEEMAKYNIKPKFSKAEQDRYYSEMEKYNLY